MSSLTDDLGDFPMVCTESGDVRVLCSILKTPDNGPAEVKVAQEKVYSEGLSARISGRPCPTCTQVSSRSCEYRPLRGPLFVPRF